MKSNHVLLNETWVGEVGRRFRCHLSPKSLSRPRSWQSSSGFQQLRAHTALEKDKQTRTEDRHTQGKVNSAASTFGHIATSGTSRTSHQSSPWLTRATIVCILFFSAGIQLKPSHPYQKYTLNYGNTLKHHLPLAQPFLAESLKPRSSRPMRNAALQKWLCTKHYRAFNFKTAIKMLPDRSHALRKQSAPLPAGNPGLPAPRQLPPWPTNSCSRITHS